MSLSLEPPAPVKGRDKEARLTVRMLREDGAPDDSEALPVVRSNVGRVEALERVEPGVWRARYVLPDTRYPEVAILVALAAWPHPQSIYGAYGTVRVPLAAAVELPGRTEPNAQLTVSIGGTLFGPVTVGADGRFRLPVIVPPGNSVGLSRTVDAAGNQRHTKIDLNLPPTDGLACVLNPQRLPVDGTSRARLLCATSDPQGRPVNEARVQAHARYGTLSGPTRAEGGLLEWLYTAPTTAPGGSDQLVATWPERGAGSREVREVQFVQGPVARVDMEAAGSVVYLGSSLGVTVRAWDALGQPRPGAQVAFSAPVGTWSPPREEGPGVFTSTWTLPSEGPVEAAAVEVRAWGPAGTEPARLSVWSERGVLHAGVTDLAGLPLPEQPLRFDGQARVTGAEGSVVLGPAAVGRHEVTHERWPGLRRTVEGVAEGGPVFPEDTPLAVGTARREVRLAPAVPVNVRLEARGPQVTYWMEDASGRVLEGREAYVWLSAGERSAVEMKNGRGSFSVRAPGPVSVSVADVATGVTALLEVRP